MYKLLDAGMNMRSIKGYEHDILVNVQPSSMVDSTNVTCVFAGVALF
jgi:hypothetical protein